MGQSFLVWGASLLDEDDVGTRSPMHSVAPYPALRCEYYSLARALAQNHVIAWNTLTQGINACGSSIEGFSGFEPDRLAVLDDLEDVKGLSRHHSMISTLTRLCSFMPAA